MTAKGVDVWRRRFRDLNDCPWPGPRPLLDAPAEGASRTSEDLAQERFDAARQLRGRDLEVSDLAMACLSNHLVVVHGQSGVGKSSIINVGLMPELESLGKLVVLRKDWGVAGSMTPSEFVSMQAVQDGLLPHDPFADDLEGVDREFPNRLVFVLDQFEELIRSDPGFAHRVLRWIEEVVGKTSAKFVISLRSEYEHQLRDLRTKPFTKRARIEISPIRDLDTIETIIGGDPDEDDDVMPVADDAKDRLTGLWGEAQDDPDVTTWSRPGLLHLQATLYVLWMSRTTREGGPYGVGVVTLADVETLCDDHQRRLDESHDESHDVGDRSLFGYGLERSVESSITTCIAACRPCDDLGAGGVSRVVEDQTRWIFRDITQYLASGGYKTQQDVWELAHRALAYLDEPALRTTPSWAPRLYEDPDWLGARAEDYGLGADGPGLRSPLASGPAAALTTDQLLFELYRCYFFALEWLRRTNIVQVLPSGSSHRVTLSHDRFSEGLASWRRSQVPDFAEAVGRYVAHRGKADLVWTTLQPRGGEDRVVANVRWRQCVVSDTTFHDMTFVNCDFAGSTFDSCIFDGAVFVNCVLNDVDFVGCTIRRAPQWGFSNQQWADLDDETRRPLVEDPPTFTMPVDPAVARAMMTLLDQGDGDLSTTVSSPPSGTVVATVLSRAEIATTSGNDRRADAAPELPAVRGGLVMCGGRLSSLTFRRCTFAEGAKVVLRHIAGTSLEICDQTHGTFDVFAAAIRGLAVTLPVVGSGEDEAESAAGNGADLHDSLPSFTFDVRYAKVINTWLGVGLVGEATFDECNVWQLINASDTMTVHVANSAYFGLVNTGPVADPTSLPLGQAHFTESALSEAAADSVRQVSANIDIQEA